MSDSQRVKDSLDMLALEWHDARSEYEHTTGQGTSLSFSEWFAQRTITDDDGELLNLVLASFDDEDARDRLDHVFGGMDDEDDDDEEA